MWTDVKIAGKKVVKILSAACLATGAVVLGAVAANAIADGTVAERFSVIKNREK